MIVRALLVGINSYGEPGWKLDNPARHAWGFARWLVDGCGVEPEHVQLFAEVGGKPEGASSRLERVIPQKINRGNLEEAIGQLQHTRADRLVVYWGGHGFLSSGEEKSRHVLLPEATKDRLDNFSFADLETFLLERVPILKQLLVLDGCAEWLKNVGTLNSSVNFSVGGFDPKQAADGVRQLGVYACQLYEKASDENGLSAKVLDWLGENAASVDFDLRALDRHVQDLFESKDQLPLVKYGGRFWNGDGEVKPRLGYLTAPGIPEPESKFVFPLDIGLEVVEKERPSAGEGEERKPLEFPQIYTEDPKTLRKRFEVKPNPQVLRAWLQEPSKVHILLGEPGGGKTTLLREWGMELGLKYGQDQKQPMPIYVPLRNLNNANPDCTEELNAYLKKETSQHEEGPMSLELIRVGRHAVVWLLDGWDELPDTTGERWKALVEKLPGVRIVSCRTAPYKNEFGKPHYLMGLGYKVQRKYLEPKYTSKVEKR